jgi:hypothetical protein
VQAQGHARGGSRRREHATGHARGGSRRREHATGDAARAHEQQSTDAADHERTGAGRECSLAGQGQVGTGDEAVFVTSAGRAAQINRLAESRRVQRAHHHQGPLPGRRASCSNVLASPLRRDRCNDVHWHPATRAVANHIDQRTASRQAQRSQNLRGSAPERPRASTSRIPTWCGAIFSSGGMRAASGRGLHAPPRCRGSACPSDPRAPNAQGTESPVLTMRPRFWCQA